MHEVAAWITLVGSAVLVLVTAFVLRARLAPRSSDALLALGGAGVGIGGLLFFDDVSVATWVIAPLFLAVGAVVHARALFAGAGPFRT